MKAKITGWEVKEVGPALWTGRQEDDGSTSYEGISEVTMKFDVVGNVDATAEFLRGVSKGMSILGIKLGAPSKLDNKIKIARRYVFDE